MENMVTGLLAGLAIFGLISMWIIVDHAARKRLGERSHHCHAADPDGGHGCACGRSAEMACSAEDRERCQQTAGSAE